MTFDLAMTDELLATTRSVRKRLDLERAVPREVILECLELAVQAPNGGNRQNWRWVVVDEPGLKQKLAGIYQATAEDYFAVVSADRAHQRDEQTARIYQSWRWLVDNLAKVPVLVIPCVEEVLEPGAPLARMSAYFGSIFPGIWNFQLALRARGMGSTLTTLHLSRAQEAAELLGIPAGVVQIALLPVAYTKGSDFKRANRLPLSTITHWNGW